MYNIQEIFMKRYVDFFLEIFIYEFYAFVNSKLKNFYHKPNHLHW